MRTPHEIVEANFGAKKFQFDFEQYKLDEKQRVLTGLMKVPDPLNANYLVLSYLTHHGYSETLKLFARDTGMNGPQLEVDLVGIENRHRICNLLRKGEIDEVIRELTRVYPDFLPKRQDVLFKLLSQKFVEMIKHAPIEDTMLFGQTELYKFEKDFPENKKDLEEVFSLVAYIDPHSSPVSYLLDEARRDPLIADLHCALLVHVNRPPVAPLEKMLRQTSVILEEALLSGVGPASSCMNIQEILSEEGNR